MDDNAAYIDELKRQFCNGEPRREKAEWHLQRYEQETDPKERDKLLASLWNWSLSQPWAWDTLVEFCRRTPKLTRHEKTAPILIDFAMMAATGQRTKPKSGPGRPVGDINETLDILVTVRVLIKDYGYTKTAAYKTVSEWCNESGGKKAARSPDAIRKIVKQLTEAKPFPSGRK